MAKSYSIDLREKAIKAVNKGKSVSETAELFSISSRVIYQWINLQKKTNSLEPKTNYQKGHSHKITDWNDFKEFASVNRYNTVKEMVVKWEQEKNDTISSSVIERGLKKIGYSSKKNVWLYRS